MGDSSALCPETFTSLETLSSLLLRDSGSAIPSGKAPRAQTRASPPHLVEAQHVPTPWRSRLFPRHHWKGA